ncbi:MAG: TauD/TfdA family dioxygenase [Spongiibacteraceae bacterium]
MSSTTLNEHAWPTTPRKSWLPGDINIKDLQHGFGDAEIAVIKQLMAAIREVGTPLFEVTPAQFRHPVLDSFMLPLVDELKQGPGVLLLSGFDKIAENLDDWRLAYWGIGSYFGDQVSQSVRGDLMGDVKVRPGAGGDRVYTSPVTVRLHCDRIDMISLLCVQSAMKGGESGFASSLAVYDIIKRERPDLLPILERGFYQSRGNEQQPDQAAITPYRVPVFARKNGLMSCLFSGNSSLVHQQNSVKANLSAEEIDALKFLESVLERPEIRITVPMQIGEAVFLNNYEVLHARDAFEDSPDPAKKRHLLRLWIAGRPPRPRVDEQTIIVNPSGKQGIDSLPEKVTADGAIVSNR